MNDCTATTSPANGSPAPTRRHNINPSDLSDVIGEYAHADAAQAERGDRRCPRRVSCVGRVVDPGARQHARHASATTILARKDELGRLLSREEGKTLPEGIGEAARAGQIFKFFAGEALRLAGEKLPSVRPGIDVEVTREPIGVVGIITPWNFPIAIPAWKIAPALAYGNCVVFKPADLVPGCAVGAGRDHRQAPACRQGVFNLVMGRGSRRRRGDGRRSARRRRSASPARSRPASAVAAKAIARMAQGAARNGRQEPAGRPRRRRPGRRRQCAVNGAYLLDRPALHRVVAADRRRRHPRPLRRRADRAAARLKVDDALAAGHRHRAGRRRERSSSRISTTSASARRKARSWRSAASVLNRAARRATTWRRRCSPTRPTTCASSREEIFGPVASVIRVEGLRGGAGGRQRHRVRSVRRHLHHIAQARDRISSATARPAW